MQIEQPQNRRIKILKDFKLSERSRASYKYQQFLKEQYGITRDELDIILFELCEQYERQWAVISTALYRQHSIQMNQAKIKDRYRNFLDPNLNNKPFSSEEVKDILSMYYVKGNVFVEICSKYSNRKRGMVKGVLEYYVRRSLKDLQHYLEDELAHLCEDDLILGGQYRANLIRGLISDNKILWKFNKSLYHILYFFMVADKCSYKEMPKNVAMLLYKRLVELRKERDVEKKQTLKKIDPALVERFKNRSKYLKKKKDQSHWNSLGKYISGETYSESSKSIIQGERISIPNQEQSFNINQIKIENDQSDFINFKNGESDENLEMDLDPDDLQLDTEQDLDVEIDSEEDQV